MFNKKKYLDAEDSEGHEIERCVCHQDKICGFKYSIE